MDQKDDKSTCMACSCPCDMHKEHNHPTDDKAKKTCAMCGHEHKPDGSCDCGCK